MRLFCAMAIIAFVAALWPGGAIAQPQCDMPFDANAASRYQQAYAEWSGLPRTLTNGLGMTFELIPPGSFIMGSPKDEPGHNSGGYDETQFAAVLTRPFYLSKHETTVGQFRRFVEAEQYVTDGERNGGGTAHDAKADWKHRPGTSWRKPGFAGPHEQTDAHPVVHVSHADSRAFCRWLNATSPVDAGVGMMYTLPTEAQWEWACRAGSTRRYWWGADEDDTGQVANVGDQTLKRVQPEWPRTIAPMDDRHAFTAPVGSYRANGFGLHDMLGNVWEFCSTHYGNYPVLETVDKEVRDPVGGDPKRGFAVRGGGWSNIASDVRCASRNADPPHFCHSNLGFRVALAPPAASFVSVAEVIDGLQEFYRRTARADGSFRPGVDPQYRGMSDCAYSDLAAVTYAITISKTFGWKLPHETATGEFLLSRQKPTGEFYNVAGTVDPASAQGRVYNTTQGLVALHALGIRPRHNPLPVFDDVLKQDYKTLPAYATSFFPLAYLAYDRPIPPEADRKIRATMQQTDDGYLNDHIAATFHAAHYCRLIGEPTPKAEAMLDRVLRDQKRDGSWLLNQPSRDRHATFDAVFTLRHLGGDRADCQAAIRRAAAWAMTCRNADGGFGHFPGSTSDADAVYFHVGTLVMAGVLPAADPLPKDPHLLSWGHLMPLAK